jgi:hypothetical protein
MAGQLSDSIGNKRHKLTRGEKGGGGERGEWEKVDKGKDERTTLFTPTDTISSFTLKRKALASDLVIWRLKPQKSCTQLTGWLHETAKIFAAIPSFLRAGVVASNLMKRWVRPERQNFGFQSQRRRRIRPDQRGGLASVSLPVQANVRKLSHRIAGQVFAARVRHRCGRRRGPTYAS